MNRRPPRRASTFAFGPASSFGVGIMRSRGTTSMGPRVCRHRGGNAQGAAADRACRSTHGAFGKTESRTEPHTSRSSDGVSPGRFKEWADEGNG